MFGSTDSDEILSCVVFFATDRCNFFRSGYSRAKRIMYPMFRSENPLMSGSSLRMSRESRGIIAAPHPSKRWRSSIILPMSQYINIISALADMTARVCACLMRVLMSSRNRPYRTISSLKLPPLSSIHPVFDPPEPSSEDNTPTYSVYSSVPPPRTFSSKATPSPLPPSFRIPWVHRSTAGGPPPMQVSSGNRKVQSPLLSGKAHRSSYDVPPKRRMIHPLNDGEGYIGPLTICQFPGSPRG